MTAKPRKSKDNGISGTIRSNTRRNNARLIPALIAGSACGLASAPSSALQLGDLEVQSALGQPLRASIALALSPNEQVFNHCILLKPGTSADGLPMVSRANISVANGKINLVGTRVLREPMMALQIAVDCPYTANIARSYTIMLDPVQVAETIATQSTDSAISTAAPSSITRQPSPATQQITVPVSAEPIALSTPYRVKIGDTLSGIASRIENRPVGLWPAVEAIFVANPDAFIGGDVNKLKAGSMLNIPALDGVTLATIADTAPVTETAAIPADIDTEQTTTGSAYVPGLSLTTEEPVIPADNLVTAVSATPGQELVTESNNAESFSADVDSVPTTGIQPGDITIGGNATFVSPIESVDTPDTTQPVPEPTVADNVAPAVPVVRSGTATSETGGNAWSWLFWLAGSGVALILGLLLFGRAFRDRFGSVAVDTPVEPLHEDLDITARNEAINDVDIPFEDSMQSDNEYTLDADLGAGTGLNDSSDMDVAQDFGFAASGDFSSNLDMELPEDSDEEPENNQTDIIAAQHVEEASILDEEILPGGDDDYDMSMIVDATKQNLEDFNATEKDLQAVPLEIVSSGDEDTSEFSLNEPLGAQTLEQDYEDELTATQAANLEIERVALELSQRMDEGGDEQTEEMPAADADDYPTAEVTVQMPGATQAVNDDFSDLDDTGVNEELTDQLPSAESDVTVEMDVESGRVNTKNSAG